MPSYYIPKNVFSWKDVSASSVDRDVVNKTIRYCYCLDNANAENVPSRLMFSAFGASSFSRNANNGIQAMTWSMRFAVVLSSRRLRFDLESALVGRVVDKPPRRYALISISNSPPYPSIHSFIHSFIHSPIKNAV